jgi:ACR3 family arsenite efflux pump ArsB
MEKKQGIGFFEKYLTIWVALCIIIGIAVGQWLPAIPQTLSKFEYANVSIPVAILIWLMIYPMMLKVDFQSVKNVGKRPKGIIVTCVTNWLIKPFTMFGIAYFFFYVVFKTFIPAGLAEEYLAGAVLLGAAPCTAMVFVWSYLTERGCRLYAGTSGSKRFNHIGSICPYRCFPAGSWRRIYPVGHSVVIRRAVCCDTTCCRGHYPYNGYSPQRSGLFQ